MVLVFNLFLMFMQGYHHHTVCIFITNYSSSSILTFHIQLINIDFLIPASCHRQCIPGCCPGVAVSRYLICCFDRSKIPMVGLIHCYSKAVASSYFVSGIEFAFQNFSCPSQIFPINFVFIQFPFYSKIFLLRVTG